MSVLNDQVELQTEKLAEMENDLNSARERMNGADARLQQVRL